MGIQAIKELRAKILFEKELRPKFVVLFTQLARSYVQVLGTSRTVIDVQARAGDALEALLLQHYVRVGGVFTQQYRGKMPVTLAMTTDEATEVDTMATEVFIAKAPEQSAAILRTTQQNADDARDIAREEQGRLSVKGTFLSEFEVAMMAGRIFERRIMGRIPGIVTFETQWPSETAKALEVAVLVGEQDDIEFKARNLTTKTWDSQADSRVRPDHLRADGQEVPTSQPFKVGGESLMWPGDLGRGASLAQVGGCRCSAIYNVASIESLRAMLKRDAIFIDAEGEATAGVVRRRVAADVDAAATESDIVVSGQITRTGSTVPKPTSGGGGGAGSVPPPSPTIPKSPTRKLPKPKAKVPEPPKLPAATSPSEARALHLERFNSSDLNLIDDFASLEDMLGFDALDPDSLELFESLNTQWSTLRVDFGRQIAAGSVDPDLMLSVDTLVSQLDRVLQKSAFNQAVHRAIFERFADLGVRSAQNNFIGRSLAAEGHIFKRNHFFRDLDDALKEARREMKELGFADRIAQLSKKPTAKELSDLRKSGAPDIARFDEFMNDVKAQIQKLNAGNIVKRVKLSGPVDNVTTGRYQLKNAKVLEKIQDVMTSIGDRGTAAGNLLLDTRLKNIEWWGTPKQRAHAIAENNIIALRKTQETRDVIAHEFGHHIEFRNREVKERIDAWRNGRIGQARGRGESLEYIYANNKKERGWRDGFFDHYIGKVYESGHTEVLSMGIQALESPHYMQKLLQNDPEHLELMWSILRGY